MTRSVSRRALLATGTAAATAAVAGCQAPGALPEPAERVANPEEQTVVEGANQFRHSLENWGYYPEQTVPDAVEVDWRIPEHNTDDHSAAKASAVPLPEGGVVFPGDTGYLTALTPDGEIRWQQETDMEGNGIHGTPVVADGAVYIGAYDGIFYAFDAATGERLWETELGDSIGGSPTYDGDLLYVAVEYADPEGSTFAVDPASGEVVWEDPEHRPTDHPHSTPAIDRDTGTMVLGSNDGLLYAWEYPSLEFKWTFETDPQNGTDGEIKEPITVYDGAAFFGSWDQHIYRVDLETGTMDWSFETGGLSMVGPGVDPRRDEIYAGSHDGNLYALDGGTGEMRWQFETGAALTGCPTVCSDRIVFGSKDRRLYAVEIETAEEVWHVDSDGVVTSTPRVHDGAIYYAERAPDPEDGERDGGAYRLVGRG
ncbi:PQQ-binding-like beta-propeller repeat protein [Halovenus sp. WSH3]|uniref:PQQ-binding-like beta-propeller repeat protein n=1 Tax=Halovenus carboxidivorans TaxID=2692199 RepID=A0A6B0THU9_9EURY|nr:PQQ-binding-like beta-propeller repeat protein [Halovenus carboxidivorans]MXR52769.1 PQQ-binding-like beta-propeller repeat protein [Halovenus carboxidivorans]